MQSARLCSRSVDRTKVLISLAIDHGNQAFILIMFELARAANIEPIYNSQADCDQLAFCVFAARWLVTRSVKDIPRSDRVLFCCFLPFDLYGMSFTPFTG